MLIIQLGRVASETILCESISEGQFSSVGFTEALKTCLMHDTTTIDSEGFVISPADSSVLAMTFFHNKEISFLPIKVYKTFPNLEVYNAESCSLTSVSELNFKKLRKLKFLSLMDNQIERIKSDTFEDLALLETLWLGRIIFTFHTLIYKN